MTDEHPQVDERLRRFFGSYVQPVWDTKNWTYNTALYAAITPLHALLYARKWKPEVVAFDDFEGYLA